MEGSEPDLIVFDPRGVVEVEPLGVAPRTVEMNGLR